MMRAQQWSNASLGGLILIAMGTTGGALAREQLVAGMDVEGDTVMVFDTAGDTRTLTPYGAGFGGGVRVASGDINGDRVPDIITGSGPGIVASVRVFDGKSLQAIRDIEVFGPQFTGGVFVAAGDINGDGVADIVAGAGAGGEPRVLVFDGRTNTELLNFVAYEPGFQGGVYVAAGDVDGDGNDDVITGSGPGGGPHVKVFSGGTGAELNAFFAFDLSFQGGVYVAVGDWNGNGRADVITGSGFGDEPEVRIFEALSGEPLMGFIPYPDGFTGGVRVASGDVNGDGLADVITSPGMGRPPLLTRFLSPQGSDGDSVLAFDSDYLGGVFVANALVLTVIHRDGFE